MAALDAVEWEACLLEPIRDRAAERILRTAVGYVPPPTRYFSPSPGVIGAYASLLRTPVRYLSAELVEMIAFVVSQDNACRYCYTATRSMLKILGYAEPRIRRLEEDFLAADLTPSDKAALDFARCVSRASPLATCKDGAPLLEAGYTPAAVKEVTFEATVHVFLNRMATLPALPPDDMDLADRWYVRLLRPLIAPRLRPRRVTQCSPLPPAQRQGPFAEFVNALDGLPAAAHLRAMIDALWGGQGLRPATKALIFAVVARGIGCAPAEREAVRLLIDAGMSADRVESALAHLAGPDLDRVDACAASLARESIWYRPAQLQRHARAIRAQCSREQFVELIGVTALANMVCRLTPALELAHQSS
jgi:alkylhydroperoxidase family enzyme